MAIFEHGDAAMTTKHGIAVTSGSSPRDGFNATATSHIDRVYGVVPRPRSFDDPGAWPRRNALGGKGKWRQFYGYRYAPEASLPEKGSARDRFSDAAVAAAMVAHSEIGGRIVPLTQEQRLGEEGVAPVPMRRVRSATPRPHGIVEAEIAQAVARETIEIAPVAEKLTAAERFAASEAVILRKPEPDPVEVPAEPVVAAPVVMPMAAQDLRYTAAAEVLRELAASYGPRRAHKLVAMADFVEAHGKRVA